MTTLDIQRAVVSGGGVVTPVALSRQILTGEFTTRDVDNPMTLARCRAHPGKLIPCWFGNPHDRTEKYNRHGHEYAGLEVSPAVHGVPLDDPRVSQLLDQAASFGHWTYIVPINRSGCDVDALARLAHSRTDQTFVMGHLGYGNIDFAGIDAIRDMPNITVETSGGYTSVLAYAIAELGAGRIAFGSEFPLQDPAVEIAKIDALRLKPEIRHAVLGGTASRLMGESA